MSPRNQFSRPSVDVSSSGPTRAWKNIPAGEVQVGDLVADFGMVTKVESGGDFVRLTNMHANSSSTFGKTVEVFAYVQVL